MKLPRAEQLSARMQQIKESQSRTDSDMYHYFSDIELDRLWVLSGYLYERQQKKEMAEWNI